MPRLRALTVRTLAVLHRRRAEEEFAAELESHIAMHMEDGVRAGLSPEEAHRRALIQIGGAEQVRQAHREQRTLAWIESLVQDIRYGIRGLRRSPGFALTVVFTLALGIGAATAMFTVVDHALLRPLPYRDVRQLVTIQERGPKDAKPDWGVSWLDIEQWMAQNHSFSQIAFTGRMSGPNFLEGSNGAMQVNGLAVSPNLFATLGVEPALGRDFLQEPVGVGAGKNAGTVILSDGAWTEAYGADRAIVGKSVRINNKSYVVIGVMPPGLDFPVGSSFAFASSAPRVWTTIRLSDRDKTRNDSSIYQVIARLRPGVSIHTAGAEMSTIQRRIAPAYSDPRTREDRSDTAIESYANSLVAADLKKALLALFLASGVLWLIACVNATNLMLARGAARQREIAMRGALGASRSRILRQIMVESLMLSGAAAMLGTVLALVAVRLVRNVKPANLNVDLSAHVNVTILAVLCGLTLLTALVSSVWPALLAVRAPINPSLKQGGPQSGRGRRHNRIRSSLVVFEVALSLALLASCGLLLRTICTLRHVPLGYRTDHILVAHLAIPSYQYSDQNLVANLYQPLLSRVQNLHGVEAAGFMSQVPLGQSFNIHLQLNVDGKNIVAMLKLVSPEIQQIFGFKMLAGRFFDSQDTVNSQPVVVVNRAFANLYAPNKHDPASLIGKQLFGFKLRKNAPFMVAGIVDAERQANISESSQPEVEVCLPQVSPGSYEYEPSTAAIDLAVRTESAPDSIIPALRSTLRYANPEFAHATFDTMNQMVEDSYGSQRLAAHLLEIFGASALLLSIAGLYGLLAWVVAQRTREMGIRIALGAPRGNLVWLVLRQAGGMLLVGVACGAGLAWMTARFVRAYLYGVSAHDGWTMAAAAALLCASGLLAAYIPARRAARVDPIVALRAE